MNIGEEEETINVEPLSVPSTVPIEEPTPATPEREPEKVPA